MAKANEEKSGDQLAGIAAETVQQRIAAKAVLSELLVKDIRENPLVPQENDEVSRIIEGDINEQIYGEIKTGASSSYVNTFYQMTRVIVN